MAFAQLSFLYSFKTFSYVHGHCLTMYVKAKACFATISLNLEHKRHDKTSTAHRWESYKNVTKKFQIGEPCLEFTDKISDSMIQSPLRSLPWTAA